MCPRDFLPVSTPLLRDTYGHRAPLFNLCPPS
jgi:hypothetical protein